MSRAAFIYKTRAELEQMSVMELNEYIRSLTVRAEHLGTLPRKSVEKEIAVARKIRERVISRAVSGDA